MFTEFEESEESDIMGVPLVILSKEDYHHALQETPKTCYTKPPVVYDSKKDLKLKIQALIDKNNVMIFSDSTCKLCSQVKALFRSMNVSYFSLELDQTEGFGGT
uniref:Uncharacterized protein n=1 Tax=Sphaerodactylus townsendi TaxID=933632 RepID=A0ACB8FN99_9SAUR